MHLEHNSQENFFRNPFGAVTCGKSVTLRLAASEAGIPHSVKVIYMKEGGERKKQDMSYIMRVLNASIYETEIKMPESECLFWYCFEIICDEGTFYYGNNEENLGGEGKLYNTPDIPYFQITVYREDFKAPQWFSGEVAYQIFPDRFANGNEDGSFLGDRTDIIKRNWEDIPFYKAEQFGGEYLANDFFGGNLKGITRKIPYLKDLGIGVIYLNPIFKAYSNHRYDTGDYEKIDEMLGTEDDFKELCACAEKNGIRIILDGVFNHTGSNSKYFNKNGEYQTVGAYNSPSSPYYDWYNFTQYPEKYESWWGMLTLPGVREESESYREYILNGKDAIVKKWLKNGASGWRLDVADELPGFFIKELRSAVKFEKEDAVIIGEVWEDASNKSSYGERREYFLGKELDSVMNYPLKNALIDISLGRIDAAEFDKRIMSLKENYPKTAFYSLLNMLSSHDCERIITMLGEAPKTDDKDFMAGFVLSSEMYEKAKRRLQSVVGCIMLMPGVPCIYYGDEIGMQGYADPFSRCAFKWNEVRDENEILTLYKRFIHIRKSSEAFSKGEFKTVYKYKNTYGFLREWDKEKYVVLINFGDEFDNIRLDLGFSKITELKNTESDENHFAENGIYYVGLEAGGVKIFRENK